MALQVTDTESDEAGAGSVLVCHSKTAREVWEPSATWRPTHDAAAARLATWLVEGSMTKEGALVGHRQRRSGCNGPERIRGREVLKTMTTMAQVPAAEVGRIYGRSSRIPPARAINCFPSRACCTIAFGNVVMTCFGAFRC